MPQNLGCGQLVEQVDITLCEQSWKAAVTKWAQTNNLFRPGQKNSPILYKYLGWPVNWRYLSQMKSVLRVKGTMSRLDPWEGLGRLHGSQYC
jgi:hypothetical protein